MKNLIKVFILSTALVSTSYTASADFLSNSMQQQQMQQQQMQLQQRNNMQMQQNMMPDQIYALIQLPMQYYAPTQLEPIPEYDYKPILFD